MDPYQHIQPSVHYPPTLLVVGLSDSRVAPWMSAKFAARLLAGQPTASHPPVLIRTDGEDGHGLVGATKDQELLKLADEWAFFLYEFRGAAK